MTAAAGWFPDPSGRHQYRFWTGTMWSDHVADNGQETVEHPLAPPPQPTYSAVSQPMYSATQQPVQPVQPAQQVASAGGVGATRSIAVATLIGGALAGLSTMLNWLDAGGGATANGFDVPVQFLLDYETSSDSALSVGLLTLVFAGMAVLAAFVRRPETLTAARIVGGGLVTVGVVYLIQLYRLADAFGGSITDVAGIGPVFAVVAGAVVSAARGR